MNCSSGMGFWAENEGGSGIFECSVLVVMLTAFSSFYMFTCVERYPNIIRIIAGDFKTFATVYGGRRIVRRFRRFLQGG
jgi:hypothetical protein